MTYAAASQKIGYKDPASGISSIWHDNKPGASKWGGTPLAMDQHQPADILEDRTRCCSGGMNERTGKTPPSHESDIIQVGEREEGTTEVISDVNDLFGAKVGGGVPP